MNENNVPTERDNTCNGVDEADNIQITVLIIREIKAIMGHTAHSTQPVN